jgi:hypothetical protein
MCGSNLEISAMLKEAAEDVTDRYCFEFGEAIQRVQPLEHAPFEIWLGLAQALADASGYRIVLQAAVVEPIEGKPETFRTAGWKDVASVEPALFLETT